MAQPVIQDSICEVSLVGRHQAQRVLTLLHWKADVGIGVFQDFNIVAEDLLDQLLGITQVVDKYLECLSEEYTLEAIRLQIITPVRFAFKLFPQTATTGEVAEPALPPNDSATITKRNDAVGRHNRGSVHMPAVPVTFVDGGLIAAAGITAYNAFGEAITTPMTTTGGGGDVTWSPVIFNKAAPASSPVFDSATVQNTSRVQRRRTVGVGE